MCVLLGVRNVSPAVAKVAWHSGLPAIRGPPPLVDVPPITPRMGRLSMRLRRRSPCRTTVGNSRRAASQPYSGVSEEKTQRKKRAIGAIPFFNKLGNPPWCAALNWPEAPARAAEGFPWLVLRSRVRSAACAGRLKSRRSGTDQAMAYSSRGPAPAIELCPLPADPHSSAHTPSPWVTVVPHASSRRRRSFRGAGSSRPACAPTA